MEWNIFLICDNFDFKTTEADGAENLKKIIFK